MSDLRAYGPGKFNTVLDSLVYDLSLDGGADEETGSVTENGWYGLMRGPVSVPSSNLTTSEAMYLERQAGAILSENDQGFVSVEYFETVGELDEAWAQIEAGLADETETEA